MFNVLLVCIVFYCINLLWLSCGTLGKSRDRFTVPQNWLDYMKKKKKYYVVSRFFLSNRFKKSHVTFVLWDWTSCAKMSSAHLDVGQVLRIQFASLFQPLSWWTLSIQLSWMWNVLPSLGFICCFHIKSLDVNQICYKSPQWDLSGVERWFNCCPTGAGCMFEARWLAL